MFSNTARSGGTSERWIEDRFNKLADEIRALRDENDELRDMLYSSRTEVAELKARCSQSVGSQSGNSAYVGALQAAQNEFVQRLGRLELRISAVG